MFFLIFYTEEIRVEIHDYLSFIPFGIDANKLRKEDNAHRYRRDTHFRGILVRARDSSKRIFHLY